MRRYSWATMAPKNAKRALRKAIELTKEFQTEMMIVVAVNATKTGAAAGPRVYSYLGRTFIDSILTQGRGLLSDALNQTTLAGGILILLGGVVGMAWVGIMMGGYQGMRGMMQGMTGAFGSGIMAGVFVLGLVSGVMVLIGALMLYTKPDQKRTWGNDRYHFFSAKHSWNGWLRDRCHTWDRWRSADTRLKQRTRC